MSITIDDDSLRGTLVFKGCSFAVYLREIEMEHCDTAITARSLDGRLYVAHQSHPTITFTLEGEMIKLNDTLADAASRRKKNERTY